MTENASTPSPSEPPKPPVEKASGLLRSSAVVGSMTMLSRFLGLARDVVIANLLGAGSNADCFFIAFKIPNFLRRLFAEGAFSQAFVPVLAEYKEQGSHAAVQALVNRVAATLGGVLLLLTSLAVVGAPVVTMLFAPGFHDSPEKFALTADMIRITFPYLFLISMTGFAGAILNTYGRFAVPAFTPVLLNLTLITTALVASPWFEEPAMALAWGVMAAGAIQLTFQLPFLQRIHLLPKPTLVWNDPGVKRIMTLMVPALFGVSVSQINLLLDTVIASFLPTGSVSWLYYSDRLVELPLGVFAIAIGTVILPSLSKLKAKADSEAYAKTIDWAMRAVLILGVPAAAGLLILAEPILITLFQYGELESRDVTMAALSLRAYSFGLLAFMLIKVLAPGYFAQQDMKTPVRIGIIAMVANMVFNIALVVPLHHYWQVGHVGLAAATAMSGWLNAILLLRGLRKRDAYHHQKGWPRYLARLLLATAAMSAVLWFISPPEQYWLAQAWFIRASLIFGVVAAGGAVYIGVLFALGIRIHHFRQVNTSI